MSVAPRQVMVAVHHVPGTGPNLAAALRVAVGLATSYNYHHVRVVLYGDGVLCGLQSTNPGWVQRYLKSAKAHGVPLYADQESLAARGYKAEDLAPAIALISRSEYLDKWREAEVHVRV